METFDKPSLEQRRDWTSEEMIAFVLTQREKLYERLQEIEAMFEEITEPPPNKERAESWETLKQELEQMRAAYKKIEEKMNSVLGESLRLKKEPKSDG